MSDIVAVVTAFRMMLTKWEFGTLVQINTRGFYLFSITTHIILECVHWIYSLHSNLNEPYTFTYTKSVIQSDFHHQNLILQIQYSASGPLESRWFWKFCGRLNCQFISIGPRMKCHYLDHSQWDLCTVTRAVMCCICDVHSRRRGTFAIAFCAERQLHTFGGLHEVEVSYGMMAMGARY